MPTNSKVHKVYKALLEQGKSKESAAKIAQAQTGQALATGKPPKYENFEKGVLKAKDEIKNKYPKFSNDEIEGAIVWKKGDCSIVKDGFKFVVHKGDTYSPKANSLSEALTYVKRRYGLS